MQTYTFASLPDHVVAQRVDAHAVNQRTDAPLFIAEIAEFDARKLWAPAGYHSTYDYCVKKHRLDHHLTCRWIAIARLGYRYPVIFPALADGRLSQTTILLLRSHLVSHTSGALLDAAMGRSKRQVEQMLARRFPRPDVPTEIRPWASPASVAGPVSSEVAPQMPASILSNNLVAPVLLVPAIAPEHAMSGGPLTPRAPLTPPARVAALSLDRNALQVTIDDECVDLLKLATDLLSHAVPNADAGSILKRALQELVSNLQRRKLARVDHPRAASGVSDDRHIPAQVKREVSERDGDACGFKGPDGNRCGSRWQLEWDHELPVAKGGKSTTANVRQLCRAHNQFEAERRFGKGFMQRKRGNGG